MSKKIFSKNNLNLAGGIVLGFLVVTSFQNCLPTSQKTELNIVLAKPGSDTEKAGNSTKLSSISTNLAGNTHKLIIKSFSKFSKYEFNSQSPNFDIPITEAFTDANKTNFVPNYIPEASVVKADINSNYQFRDSDLNCVTTQLTFVDAQNKERTLSSLDQISLQLELPISNTESMIRSVPFFKGAECSSTLMDKSNVFSSKPNDQIISFVIPLEVAIKVLDSNGPQRAKIHIKLEHEAIEKDLYSEYIYYLDLH